MADATVNAVAILDANRVEDMKTARRLREDLTDFRIGGPGLAVRYFPVGNLGDLESAISSLVNEATNHRLKPWLHLEAHGLRDEGGFETADLSQISWSLFKELITPLNVASRFNLMLVLATCFGGSFAAAIRASDRAPVLALIGPTQEIRAGEVETDFGAFYRTFNETKSLRDAIEALTARTSSSTFYFRTSAEEFFYGIWVSYKHNECSEDQLEIRARSMHERAKAEHFGPLPSVEELKLVLRSREREAFERFRDTYFMYDLDASNRERFPVTYEIAESHVRDTPREGTSSDQDAQRKWRRR